MQSITVNLSIRAFANMWCLNLPLLWFLHDSTIRLITLPPYDQPIREGSAIYLATESKTLAIGPVLANLFKAVEVEPAPSTPDGVVAYRVYFKLAAPQGFEPRYADPESAVLPLNEGAVLSQDLSIVF